MERVTCQEGGIRKLQDCDLHIFSREILGLIPLNSYGLQALIDVMTLSENVFVLRSGFRAWYIQSGLLRSQLAPFLKRSVWIFRWMSIRRI